MSDEKGYVYRVGYLQHVERQTDEALLPGDTVDVPGVVERLTILGDYTAPNAARAVHMALDDPDHGGVPKLTGQRMVAVPVSKWNEFDAAARQQTVWGVFPFEGDQATIGEVS